MYAEFIRFYSYTAEEALNEYAKRFFALVSSMYRVKGREALTAIQTTATAFADKKDSQSVINQYKKQADGNQKTIEEVRVIRGIRNG